MLIPTNKNVKTITDMRENATELLKHIEKEGFLYIFHRSKPKAVMLSVDEFTSLQEIVEDYFDQKEAQKLARQKRGKGIPLSEIAKKYV
jgi:prevent-host-death family protein